MFRNTKNTKKEPAALLPKITDESATPTDSTISISSLLGFVNRYFPDILSYGKRKDLKMKFLKQKRKNYFNKKTSGAKDPQKGENDDY